MKRSASFLALLVIPVLLAACDLRIKKPEATGGAESSSAAFAEGTGAVMVPEAPAAGTGSSSAAAKASSSASSQLPLAQQASSAPSSPVVKRIVRIEAKRFAFVPNTIRVKKGDNVVLQIVAIDATHGFAAPDLGIDETINQGQTVTVVLPTDRTGTFQFHCSVPCGPGHADMTGQIVVE